jgi:ATP-dependent Lon protease
MKHFIDFLQSEIPVLPIRDAVLFPNMIVPLFVGRDKSVKALEMAVKSRNMLFVVTQKDPSNDNPKAADLYKVGVLCQILQVTKVNDSTVKILVEGRSRMKAVKLTSGKELYTATLKPYDDKPINKGIDTLVLRRSIVDLYERYSQLNTKVNPDLLAKQSVSTDEAFCDLMAAHLMINTENKQQILEATDVGRRMEKILECLQIEIELLVAEGKIKNRIKTQIEKHHKDYYLNEQIKAIQKELGEEDLRDEIQKITKTMKGLKLTEEAREKMEEEIKKIKYMNPMSSEVATIRTYIDWILGMPWSIFRPLNKDLKEAEKILDEEHYGLDKVKERFLEYLAINLRTQQLKSPIICLVGPPGVGKTSLVRLIAKATGREFVKIALGGLRDEAEIRGHRRTYVGAMPGKIVQAMKKAKSSNPVILLDEIDKMGFDHRGDPASALLEVLDPEQNNAFNDHYLEVKYDLSQVMFIATANSYYGIPRPLMDRMEIINLSGYTDNEKVAICHNYLLPKQLKAHGTSAEEVSIEDEAFRDIIRYYTRESGVRGLDRAVAKIVRKSVYQIVSSSLAGDGKQAPASPIAVTKQNLNDFLGPKKYLFGLTEEKDLVGVANGLAYSEVGGDVLLIESVLLEGKGGDVKSTGKLGEVMRESAQTALSFIRAHASEYGIDFETFKTKDIHIHVPEGATPKDGPSAGIAMATSLVSVLTGIPVRKDVAMTGEITLRGRVLGIGGLKEKLLAALRSGVKKALIPPENLKDLVDMPKEVLDGLEIISVETVSEVFAHALAGEFKPLIKLTDEQIKVIEPTSYIPIHS